MYAIYSILYIFYNLIVPILYNLSNKKFFLNYRRTERFYSKMETYKR